MASETTTGFCPNDLSYWKEFCTVGINLPRRTGKTYAITNLAIERFNNVIFMSHTLKAVEYMKKPIGYLLSSKKYNIEKETASQIKFRDENGILSEFNFGSIGSIDSMKGYYNIDAVIVDNSFMLSEKKKDDIYRCFGPSMTNPKFFIFIG